MFVYDRRTDAIERASVAGDGTEANDEALDPALSADGRYAAFTSCATNLVAGDTNFQPDVFVRDLATGETERVSVASGGAQGNMCSAYPSFSADGRYVAFMSCAFNLVAGDTNGSPDIFVHDRQTGETERVSVASDGTEGDYCSWDADISADGRYVSFYSEAANLVTADGNAFADVFVHDRETGETVRVSVDSDGAEGDGASEASSISADGRYVAFESSASNLVAGDTNVVLGRLPSRPGDRRDGAG